MIDQGPLTKIRFLMVQFVETRSDVEFFNAFGGILISIALYQPYPTLATNPALRSLLDIAPEGWWTAGFGLWGLLTMASWLCDNRGCRVAVLFLSFMLWSFLFWKTVQGPQGFGVLAAISITWGTTNVLAFFRMCSK